VSLGRDGEQRSSVWDPDRCGGYRDVGRCAGETEESYVERDLLPVDPLDPPGDGDVRTEEGRRLDDPIDREGIEAAFLHDFLQLAPPEDTDPARAQPIGELVGDPFADVHESGTGVVFEPGDGDPKPSELTREERGSLDGDRDRGGVVGLVLFADPLVRTVDLDPDRMSPPYGDPRCGDRLGLFWGEPEDQARVQLFPIHGEPDEDLPLGCARSHVRDGRRYGDDGSRERFERLGVDPGHDEVGGAGRY